MFVLRISRLLRTSNPKLKTVCKSSIISKIFQWDFCVVYMLNISCPLLAKGRPLRQQAIFLPQTMCLGNLNYVSSTLSAFGVGWLGNNKLYTHTHWIIISEMYIGQKYKTTDTFICSQSVAPDVQRKHTMSLSRSFKSQNLTWRCNDGD